MKNKRTPRNKSVHEEWGLEPPEGRYLGTKEERQKAKDNDRKRSIKIEMLENRLSELHKNNVVDGEEVDRLLEALYEEISSLDFCWGLEE